jgi:hypothetical protein
VDAEARRLELGFERCLTLLCGEIHITLR